MEYVGEAVYKVPQNHEGVFTQEQFEELISALSVFDCSPTEFVDYVQRNGIIEKCVGIQ